MKLSLLIEDSTWAELIAGDPAHRIPPGKLFRMLYRFSSVTGADVNFSPSRISGAFIYETLLLRAYLLYMDSHGNYSFYFGG